MAADPKQDFESAERLGPGSSTWEADSAVHIARYLYASELIQGRRVLDAGSGLGYGSALLKEAGAASVTGVDIDESSVALARASYPIDGLTYLVDDCEALANVQGPFDVICNFENIEHLPHPERFVASAARVLADDGVLLCSTPDADPNDPSWAATGKPSNPFHVTEWDRDGFRALLSKGFDDVTIHAQVELLPSLLRREAATNLEKHLNYLWSTPLVRLSRGVGKFLGRSTEWPSTLYLKAPSFDDYKIVSGATAAIFGKTVCHFAVCRGPRR